MTMAPLSTGRSPDTAFRKVDLPAPFEPMTVTNCPVGISNDIPRSARVSMGVPGLNVMCRSLALSILSAPFLLAAQTLLEQWDHQGDGDQYGGHKIQVLGFQAYEV